MLFCKAVNSVLKKYCILLLVARYTFPSTRPAAWLLQLSGNCCSRNQTYWLIVLSFPAVVHHILEHSLPNITFFVSNGAKPLEQKKKKKSASRVSRTCSHRASLHRSRTLYSLDHRFRVFIHLKLQHKSRFIFSPAFRFAFVNSCLSRALTANLL